MIEQIKIEFKNSYKPFLSIIIIYMCINIILAMTPINQFLISKKGLIVCLMSISMLFFLTIFYTLHKKMKLFLQMKQITLLQFIGLWIIIILLWFLINILVYFACLFIIMIIIGETIDIFNPFIFIAGLIGFVIKQYYIYLVNIVLFILSYIFICCFIVIFEYIKYSKHKGFIFEIILYILLNAINILQLYAFGLGSSYSTYMFIIQIVLYFRFILFIFKQNT